MSIAYVAIENLVTTEFKPWRLALVFVFGLLHGMGFAGVLSDLGLPRGEFLTALLSFNLGVEARPADRHRDRGAVRLLVSPSRLVSPARGGSGVAGDCCESASTGLCTRIL